jgi:pimeloyl-ACP methyl ester carboxylesterase
MRSVPRKVLRATIIAITTVLTLLVVLTVGNLALTAFERNKYKAPGNLALIEGKRVHVYSEGTGPTNVILLSGWGTACPVLDFKPLLEILSRSFRVTVVEDFGYGWSDWTSVPRTNENVVEEIRLALKESGVYPPYTLVPHSISGFYALYYANKYPDEVEAVVGLDTGVPDQSRL